MRCRTLPGFLQLVLPNPQHPPAHRVVASPLYAAHPPQGAAGHVAAWRPVHRSFGEVGSFTRLYVVHHPVADFVALDFTSPPSRAVRRPSRVLGAAMPETAVNEQCEPHLPEHEIRPYAKGRDGPPGCPLIIGRAVLPRRLILLAARQHGPTTNFDMSSYRAPFFIPDLVVDFQQLRSITFESLRGFKQVATLDSPFAESVLARLSRYFNRLGTPDVGKNVVINRLQTSLKRTSTSPNNPPSVKSANS